MQTTVNAVFDGKVFRPTEPVALAPDSLVQIRFKSRRNGKKPRPQPTSFLRATAALKLRGPADWSEHFEDYLTGQRKIK